MKARFEQIIPDENSALHAFYVDLPCFNSTLHYHPEFEITLILSGSGTTSAGDRIRSFGAMDLCLLGENLPHFYHNKNTGENPSERSRAEVLQFNRKDWAGFIDEIPDTELVTHLLEKAGRGLLFEPETAARAAPIMKAIREQSGLQRIQYFIQLLELLTQSSSKFLACPDFSSNLDYQSERISRACNYILENFDRNISHLEVAEYVHLSPAAFSRLFRRATQKTYTEFLSRIRLGHAGRLLQESELSVADVCFSSGFQNLSNFNRRFKACFGTSPRVYRNSLLSR